MGDSILLPSHLAIQDGVGILLAQRGNYRTTERNLRHEVAVLHAEVEPRCASRDDSVDVLLEVKETCVWRL